MTKKRTQLVAAILVASLLAGAPVGAMAQSKLSKRRQETKNEWRNLAIGGGAIALLGLLKNDSTLTFVGTTGALYSAYRYEQDRKSQSKVDRARAEMFSRRSFTNGGYKYTRQTKWKNGQKYFCFAKTKIHR